MIVEAVLWTVAALIGPDLVSLVLGRWRRIAGEPLVSFGGWIRSLGIPYLALISGGVAARDIGLSGHSAVGWLQGALVCAGVLALARVAAGWRRSALPYARPGEAALDEPRWALYRGTGSLLAGPRWAGPLVGLGIGVIEWTLSHRPWVQGVRLQASAWAHLARVCGSTALFLLTRNLWLVGITQIGLSWILSSAGREAREAQA